MRLGIRLERIEPDKPQQNGRQERFHLTLKLEVSPAASLRQQQRAVDLFRREYNHERPHEALRNATPVSVYERSGRSYPRPLECPVDAYPHAHACRADNDGFIRWNRHRVFISAALAGEHLSVGPGPDTRWLVYFGPILLGSLDDAHPKRGLIRPPRRPRKGLLSTMSLADSTPPSTMSPR